VLGVPFYGRTFTLDIPDHAELGAPARGQAMQGPYTREAGFLGFNEICEILEDKAAGWSVVFDLFSQTPHMFEVL
jgi:chitinase